MTFWEKFYSLCVVSDVKPNNVAKALGFSSAVCTQWKQGLQKPSYEKASKIAKYFGVSLSQLLDEGPDSDNAFLQSLEEMKQDKQKGKVFVPHTIPDIDRINPEPKQTDIMKKILDQMSTEDLIQLLGEVTIALQRKQGKAE